MISLLWWSLYSVYFDLSTLVSSLPFLKSLLASCRSFLPCSTHTYTPFSNTIMNKMQWLKSKNFQTTFFFFQLLLNKQQRFNPETQARVFGLKRCCLFNKSWKKKKVVWIFLASENVCQKQKFVQCHHWLVKIGEKKAGWNGKKWVVRLLTMEKAW